MRKTTAAIGLILVLAASSATAFTLWNDTRSSALLPDQTVVLRTENPSGGGITNSVLYADGGIQELLRRVDVLTRNALVVGEVEVDAPRAVQADQRGMASKRPWQCFSASSFRRRAA